MLRHKPYFYVCVYPLIKTNSLLSPLASPVPPTVPSRVRWAPKVRTSYFSGDERFCHLRLVQKFRYVLLLLLLTGWRWAGSGRSVCFGGGSVGFTAADYTNSCYYFHTLAFACVLVISLGGVLSSFKGGSICLTAAIAKGLFWTDQLKAIVRPVIIYIRLSVLSLSFIKEVVSRVSTCPVALFATPYQKAYKLLLQCSYSCLMYYFPESWKSVVCDLALTGKLTRILCEPVCVVLMGQFPGILCCYGECLMICVLSIVPWNPESLFIA